MTEFDKAILTVIELCNARAKDELCLSHIRGNEKHLYAAETLLKLSKKLSTIINK